MISLLNFVGKWGMLCPNPGSGGRNLMRRSRLVVCMASVAVGLLAMLGALMSESAPALTSLRGVVAPIYAATSQVENDQTTGGAAAASSATAGVLAESEWPMAGANPQRTSWTSEEVRGQLYPVWYKPIEAYIPPRVQIIAFEDRLYIASAKGLYALDVDTGALAWIYPTELPLGHSPTLFNDVAYVGGFDKRLHAINAQTGEGIWIFEAGAGFQTNPLVLDINGHTYIYAGNRDGYMYAIEDHGTTASLLWKHPTGGPILFSAAYLEGTIYFASNDTHAYALNAQSGELVWKSAKLPGAGFHSWWPVIYQDPGSGADVVILAGSSRYRRGLAPGPQKSIDLLDRDAIYPDHLTNPQGTPVGPRTGDGWIDATRITQYYEDNPAPDPTDPEEDRLYKPWRRTYLVLDRTTGQELTFDTDGDGHPEYAPLLTFNTQSGNRYPPVVGSDKILYQTNNYMSGPWITGGHVSGWRYGTPLISTPSSRWLPVDEPAAYSAGGNLIYWNYWNGNGSGAFDVTLPNTRFWDNGDPGTPDETREWVYFEYNLKDIVPVRSVSWEMWDRTNMVYEVSGEMNPPIPYKGKVYMHVANSVIAFAPQGGSPQRLPLAESMAVSDANISLPNQDQLKAKLASEVQKILDSGHLRPGYFNSGLFDGQAHPECGDNLADYWHSPSDTLYTLIRALPHLPGDLQQSTKSYLQNEFAVYAPYNVVHVGWRDGTNRDDFLLPPEVEADLVNHPPSIWSSYSFVGWGGMDTDAKFPPHMFYALWKYAQIFGGARQIFDDSQHRLEPVPGDAILAEYPFVHNAYIAGYLGYLELEKLAGYPTSSSIRTELDRLLELRVTTFAKDTPYYDIYHCRTLSIARNFMFLVPESGQYLHDHALAKVKEALDEYTQFNPYWFVSKFEATAQEGTLQILYDYNALFQAKALILKESREELAKYLDVPAFARGDLFYIQNLIAAIEAPRFLKKAAGQRYSDQGATITYTLSFFGTGNTLALTDTLSSGVSAPGNFELAGTSVTPTYDNVLHGLTWSETPSAGQAVAIGYSVVIVTSGTVALVNLAELTEVSSDPVIATAVVLANPYLVRLPLILEEITE
jgi:hypothetical protein